MSVLVVASFADVTVTIDSPLTHQCPYADEVDRGTVTITWRVAGATLELHSLQEYLDAFKDAKISHEEITARIRLDLSMTQGVDLLSVETTWDTADMEVRCATSPTRQLQVSVTP